MQLPTEIFGDVVVIHSPEELAADQAEAFERLVADTEPRRVVLDLDNTEALDSRGLEAVLNAHEHLRKEGGDVRIATTNAINRKILEITRLDQKLDVFDCVIDAVKSYR
jgi:anti-anti-sigma factor